MSTRRPPAPPPQIDGYEHVEHLGSGGFSDVYLYEQQRPRRRVAVKVLLHDLAGPDARERFDHEANLMAQLSTHPSIVTIYEADLARDGRAFLAMEYCSRPHLGATYRRDPLSVAEALRIGIQVAGAVETAHRAGILHRDIKPANILVTEYNRPALTDFGISATVDALAHEAEGMSIPWSPPESFTDPPTSSVASDVWALGATIYSLLAGRSPFEVPGGRNGAADLIARIERTPVPPTGRSDVPASLEQVLARAMAKDPLARFGSALALARAWQQVQVELAHAMTPVDVLDDSVGVVPLDDDDEPGTRVRRVTSIDPHEISGGTGPTDPGPTLPGETLHRPPLTHAPAPEETVLQGAPRDVPTFAVDEVEETVLRSSAPAPLEVAPDPAPVPAEAPPRRRRWPLVASLGAIVVVGGAALAMSLGGEPRTTPSPTTPPSASPVDLASDLVPAPTELTASVTDGTATFTWTNPDPEPGDSFLWRTVSVLETGELERVAEPSVAVEVPDGGQVCVEVVLRRDTGRTSEPVRGCTP